LWNAAESSVPATSRRLDVPIEMVGGLPIAVMNRAQSAQLMTSLAAARRDSNQPPLIFTSANGQVLSMCAQDAEVRQLFMDADVVHADGMPMVFASQWLSSKPLPERVATTDLFHDVAKLAETRGTTFYMLGGTAATVELAVRRMASRYPRLRICGYHNGYFSREQEPDIVARIDAAAPDILWIGMGVPRELEFAARNRRHLRRVGLIKTAGGLFDFLSGKNRRAPDWMQAAGLEWAFRVFLEPQRLAGRYLMTNPHAAFLLLTRTRQPSALALGNAKIDAS
jgi:N-acetylglucosaminyldiphosphoundecaprenol N-acetyl-beta-D-mannosaminyltransferase